MAGANVSTIQLDIDVDSGIPDGDVVIHICLAAVFNINIALDASITEC